MVKGRRRRDDLLKLMSKFDVKKGKRLMTLSYLSRFCHSSGMKTKEIRKVIKGAANLCLPPYPSDGTDKSLNQILKATQTNSDGIFSTVSNDFLVKHFLLYYTRNNSKYAFKVSEDLCLESIRVGKAKTAMTDKQKDVEERKGIIQQTIDAGHNNLKHLLWALSINGVSITQRTLQRNLKEMNIRLK